MPELPDVEVFRRYLVRTSLNKKIKDVEITNSSVLSGVSKRGLATKLKGKKIKSTSRHGKYLLAKMSDGNWLIFHFGMTGFFKYFKNGEEQPDHTRILINFANGYNLAYDCRRKLGIVALYDDIEKFIEEKELGPDALELKKDQFKEIIISGRGSVKSSLMNQGHMAEIGNIYSDEILFQAGYHPKSRVENLEDKDMDNIYRKMRKTLKTAIDKKADPQKLPRSFLLRSREKGNKCPKGDNGRIEKKKISGRPSYFCNKHQKKI